MTSSKKSGLISMIGTRTKVVLGLVLGLLLVIAYFQLPPIPGSLIEALEDGDVDWAKNLVERGANANERSDDDYYALDLASELGDAELVHKLLEAVCTIRP